MALGPHSSQTADSAHLTAVARSLIASLLAGGTKPGGAAAFPKPLDRPLPAEREDGPATTCASGPAHGSP